MAGLSTAYHLAKNRIPVTVYEAKIWDKPCGGAISREFSAYLSNELDIHPKGYDFSLPRLKFEFSDKRFFFINGFFSVISRKELQSLLIKKISCAPGVSIKFKRIYPKDIRNLSPQIVMACGAGGLVRHISGQYWSDLKRAFTCRYQGTVVSGSIPDHHLMSFSTSLKGYGWIFFGPDNRINIGAGGMVPKNAVLTWLESFISNISRDYGLKFRFDTDKPEGWKIPVRFSTANAPAHLNHDSHDLFFTGDSLGVAHPIIGAGIEPAWQTGWLLAESTDPKTGKINPKRYQDLLRSNHRLTCRKFTDHLLTFFARCPMPMPKDHIGYFVAKYFAARMIRKTSEYPWFAMVHDGKKKTGYRIKIT